MWGAEWWTVVGSGVWTVGGGIQAYREVVVLDRFYRSVWSTAKGIEGEQARALIAKTKSWQLLRRLAIKRAVEREGWDLLTDDERTVARDMDLRALGWTVVCLGGSITTAAAMVTAIGG